MMSRIALFAGLLGFAITASAEMIQAPQLLVYAPHMLQQYVGSQGQLPFQGALPAGSGRAIMAFAHLLGLIAVFKSCTKANAITNTNSHHQEGGWTGVIVMFVAGILVFHIDKTMRMLGATIPGFPDLTPVLSY
jgi:hypothetical protein